MAGYNPSDTVPVDPDFEGKKWYCPRCDRAYASEAEMEAHLAKHYDYDQN